MSGDDSAWGRIPKQKIDCVRSVFVNRSDGIVRIVCGWEEPTFMIEMTILELTAILPFLQEAVLPDQSADLDWSVSVSTDGSRH